MRKMMNPIDYIQRFQYPLLSNWQKTKNKSKVVESVNDIINPSI